MSRNDAVYEHKSSEGVVKKGVREEVGFYANGHGCLAARAVVSDLQL